MKDINLDNIFDRFLIYTILQIIAQQINEQNIRRTSIRAGCPGVAEVFFTKKLFKNIYNVKLINNNKLISCFEFLADKGIAFPISNHRGQPLILDNLDWNNKKYSVALLINVDLLFKELKTFSQNEQGYLLKSKRISLNLFTGMLLCWTTNRKFKTVLNRENVNYQLLSIILSSKDKKISVKDIRLTKGPAEPKKKISKLRGILEVINSKDIRENNSNVDEYVKIKYKNGYYYLIEK